MSDELDGVHGADDIDDANTPLDAAPLNAADDAFVAGLLATLPAVRMPAEVAARVDAAMLAAASTPDAAPDGAGAAPAAPAAAATVVALDEARAARRGRGTRILGIAAVLVAVVGGGVFAVKALGGGSPSSSTTAGGANAETAVSHSMHTYTDAQLAADVTLLSAHDLPSPAATLPSPSDKQASPTSAGSSSAQSIEPGSPSSGPSTGLTPTTSGSPGGGASPVPDAGTLAALFTTDATLVPCLAAVEDGLSSPVAPVAMDVGIYRGQAALVVVLPADVDATRAWDVFVVGAACGQGSDAHVLYYLRVDKH